MRILLAALAYDERSSSAHARLAIELAALGHDVTFYSHNPPTFDLPADKEGAEGGRLRVVSGHRRSRLGGRLRLVAMVGRAATRHPMQWWRFVRATLGDAGRARVCDEFDIRARTRAMAEQYEGLRSSSGFNQRRKNGRYK